MAITSNTASRPRSAASTGASFPLLAPAIIPSLSDDAELVRDLPPYPFHHSSGRTPDAGPSAALCVDTFHLQASSPEAR